MSSPRIQNYSSIFMLQVFYQEWYRGLRWPLVNSDSEKPGRNEMKGHPFKSPLFPISNYVTIVFLSLVLVGMWFNPDTHVSLIVGAVFLAIVIAGLLCLWYGKKTDNARRSRNRASCEIAIPRIVELTLPEGLCVISITSLFYIKYNKY